MSDDIDAKLDRIFAGEPERAPDPAVLSAENNRTLRNMCIALEDKNTELRRGIERIRRQAHRAFFTPLELSDLCTKLLAGEAIESPSPNPSLERK